VYSRTGLLSSGGDAALPSLGDDSKQRLKG
jgi:hypothetical protein